MELASGLVRFPGAGEAWQDSHEGGLFVMLFVPEPEGFQHECHVDVAITASSPDAMVYPKQNLWPNRHTHGRRLNTKANAAAVLKEHGNQELHLWAWNTADHDDQSVNMLAAVHLGSTHQTLQNAGGLWEATYEDLTSAGQALHDALRDAWGVTPVIQTFIDT